MTIASEDTGASADNPTVKIGHVSARTGLLAGFAEADDYIPDGIVEAFGAFIFLPKLRISPDAAFSVNDWTVYVIFIGDTGTVEGPIIGTILFFLLRETLADPGTTYLLILGAVAIAVMLKAPKGVWGIFTGKTAIPLVPIRRHVIYSAG